VLVDLIIGNPQQAIINGESPPCMRLTEERPSKQPNTGRTTLRGSRIELEDMGFVGWRSRGRCDMGPLDVDTTLECCHVKVMIEFHAVLRSG
jgi:DNA-binding GntR family transcriptional regulator